MVQFRCALIGLLVALLLGSGLTARAETQGQAEPLTVYVGIGLLDVDAISSVDQNFTVNVFLRYRWHDPSLAHAGSGNLRRKLSEINAPQFLLLNNQRSWSTSLEVADISPDGEVVYGTRLWGSFSQIMVLSDFPFDRHRFSIPIVATKLGNSEVILLPDPEVQSFKSDVFSVADWKITGAGGSAQPIELHQGMQVPGVVWYFDAQRRYQNFMVKYMLPLLLIVAMSWIVFWINPGEAGTQLAVATTSMLTLIAYHISLNSRLPDLPYLTRLDLFLFCATMLVFCSLIQVVTTSYLYRHGRELVARQVDRVCRLVFPLAYLAVGWCALTIELPLFAH